MERIEFNVVEQTENTVTAAVFVDHVTCGVWGPISDSAFTALIQTFVTSGVMVQVHDKRDSKVLRKLTEDIENHGSDD